MHASSLHAGMMIAIRGAAVSFIRWIDYARATIPVALRRPRRRQLSRARQTVADRPPAPISRRANGSAPRARRAMELHPANRREQEKRSLVLCESGRGGDPGGLRERFRQDHTRDERISRKMPGEHRIARVEKRPAFRRNARIHGDDVADENKRRPMREAEKRSSAQY